MLMILLDYQFVLNTSAQRLALAAGGRDEIRFESRKKPEARKMPENAAESHQSAARFVGRFLIYQGENCCHSLCKTSSVLKTVQ